MRSYLYVWNDPAKRRIVTSGLEFKDLLPVLTGRGVYLLRHQREDSDSSQGFDFVPATELGALAAEDVYSWGGFVWVDYPEPLGLPHDPRPKGLPRESIAELLYFGHAHEPLRDITIPGLGNRFLASSHDDGWRLVLWYSDWRHNEDLLRAVLAQPSEKIMADLRAGSCGSWLEDGKVETEEMTLDIDALLNRRRPS
jgi:hypothetical protein